MYSMMHARLPAPLNDTRTNSNGDRRPVASVLLSTYRLLLTELELPSATVLYDQAHGYSSVQLGFDQRVCVCVAGGGLGDRRERCEVLVGCRGGGWTPARRLCANGVCVACVCGRAEGGIPALSQPALSVSTLT